MSDYKILILDYEPRAIQQLLEPLQNAGYETHVAKDGIVGMEVFQKLKPDLTLIEAMLPKKHGFEVCQELKKTPHGSMTPIVIVTSVYKGRKYRTQALHHYGCDEYLEKPIDPALLLSTVQKLLRESGGTARPSAAPPAPATRGGQAVSAPPAQGGSVRPGSDNTTELEIMERLDEILPSGPRQAAPDPSRARRSGGHDEPESIWDSRDNGLDPMIADRNVVSFDPSRARRRHVERSSPAPAVAATGGRHGSAEIASPLTSEPVPLPVSADAEPQASPLEHLRVDALANPDAGAGRRGGRVWVWLLIALMLVLAGCGLAYFFLLGRV